MRWVPPDSGTLDDAGGTALEEMEKQMIREALSRHNSKKEVADELPG